MSRIYSERVVITTSESQPDTRQEESSSIQESQPINFCMTSDSQENPPSGSDPTPYSGPIRVPGTYPPEWLPDNDTDSCMSCDSLFTLIKRRHHCRSCGKIFCGECCRQKAKLLYLDNKEARVCSNCFQLIQTLLREETARVSVDDQESRVINSPTRSSATKVHGVLKSRNWTRTSPNECNTSGSSNSNDQPFNKQVIFADGIRPGTDLYESYPYSSPSSSGASSALLTRQSRAQEDPNKKERLIRKDLSRNITVCDELGYLPPIVINDEQQTINESECSKLDSVSKHNSSIKTRMESRNCPLNGVMNFEDLANLIGEDGVVTFLLLKDFFLKVKLVKKTCCIDKDVANTTKLSNCINSSEDEVEAQSTPTPQYYWCFASEGLSEMGQSEVLLVIDKDKDDSCVPRDVFKIYLTLHELALRRQSLESLGNLLFQDGLFKNRDTAGLLFVQPLDVHCLENLVIPAKKFLVALILQRWEVPWSKVFPIRLLLRLGHKFSLYPYPIISFRSRDPVYYEVGHTIISILSDFRNFRYSLTHVDGLKVMLNKKTRKVLVQLNQSSYQQFNKVLDSSNNEHVLAWSSCPFSEADGHLVSVQTEDGQYETVEFYKDPTKEDSREDSVIGASFIIFSGALKVDQSGQSAKISIVEDGLLIQIQSCTMTALRNAIHFMHHFDIECGKYYR